MVWKGSDLYSSSPEAVGFPALLSHHAAESGNTPTLVGIHHSKTLVLFGVFHLGTKSFHEIWAGNVHACPLTSRIGKSDASPVTAICNVEKILDKFRCVIHTRAPLVRNSLGGGERL